MKNLTTSTNLESSVQSADLVIEAITENMSAKKQLFSKLDKAAPQWVWIMCVLLVYVYSKQQQFLLTGNVLFLVNSL